MMIEEIKQAARQYNATHHQHNPRVPEIRFVPAMEVFTCVGLLELVDFACNLPHWAYLSADEDGHYFMDEENRNWIVTVPDEDGDYFLMQGSI